MAPRKTPAAPAAEPTLATELPEGVHRSVLDLQYINLGQIKPYALNARDNEIAVPAVMQSIKVFGFRIPIVLDPSLEIVAGHTRVEAAKRLGMTDVPAFIASDLTPEQIKAFRLVDNKTAELASWDFDLLASEVAGLTEVGIDLTPYGWTSEELDCLREVVSEDDLDQTAEQMAAEGDGVNRAAVSSGLGATHITADAKSVRISIGEFNFFIGVPEYRAWADKVRARNQHDKTAIIEDLAGKLEMLDEAKSHDRRKVAAEAKRSGTGKEGAVAKVVETQVMRKRTPPAPAPAAVASNPQEAAARSRTRARPAS